MKSVKIDNVCFGEGRTKIIVPLVGMTGEDIDIALSSLLASPADMIEWRIDLFSKSDDSKAVLDKLSQVTTSIKEAGADIPLLVTYRSKPEGGEGALAGQDYLELVLKLIESKLVDAVDIELCHGESIVLQLVEKAKEAGVATIISSHDFEGTPDFEEITSRLLKMATLGCDIAKIAVMPKSSEDVITLMQATKSLFEREDMPPMITMSMGELGVVSRIVGSKFGSCASFASCGSASAPGQVEIGLLSYVLCLE